MLRQTGVAERLTDPIGPMTSQTAGALHLVDDSTIPLIEDATVADQANLDAGSSKAPDEPAADQPGSDPARVSRRVRLVALGLLSLQAALIGFGLSRNAVTFDEVCHLPAGISYWHSGQFWCYHHNPPLIRLIAALPAVLSGVPVDYQNHWYTPGSRVADEDLAKRFMRANQADYLGVFIRCRIAVVAITVFGGYIVFRWSSGLFGGAGGLISLALWVFCPNVLAHGGLVTTDLGATALGFGATYLFWYYLRKPSLGRAITAGVALGLTEASKYSFVVLPFIWAGLATLNLAMRPAWLRGDAARALLHASALGLVAVLVINNIYLAEGTGKALGSFDFRSKLLTKEIASGPTGIVGRENRFRGTFLAGWPVPLPEHYVLGFDDQTYDVDTMKFAKYLRGEVRNGQDGWWYYYLYCLLVKTPLGTLLLGGLSVIAARRRSCRSDLVSEATLAFPPLTILVLVSSQTGLNSHLRYVLPVFPFAFTWAGRLGHLVTSEGWATRATIGGGLLATATSVVLVHPNYLAYFNEAAGGPDAGIAHLADSNLDWGQGLVALHDWVDDRARGRPLMLAYFGRMAPELLNMQYELPPFGPASNSNPPPMEDGAARRVGPAPGLQAISANYLVGCFTLPAPNGDWGLTQIPPNCYDYYKKFTPVAIAAHSIYIYDLKPDEVDLVRRRMGLPPWVGPPAPRNQGSESEPSAR